MPLIYDHQVRIFYCRDGMVKMSETCEQFGGDIQTIKSQLDANSKEIDKASSLLHQYQVWVLVHEPNHFATVQAMIKICPVKSISEQELQFDNKCKVRDFAQGALLGSLCNTIIRADIVN